MSIWTNKTLSIDSTSDKKLTLIQDALGFSDAMDAYKFCLAVGLTCDIRGTNEQKGERATKYAMGNFDSGREIEQYMLAKFGRKADVDHQQLLQSIAEETISTVYALVEEEGVYNFDVLCRKLSLPI